MPVFQVSSRSERLAAPPKTKPRRLRPEWSAVLRFALAVSGAAGLFVLFVTVSPFKGPSNTVFILLPVFVYLATVQFQRYNVKAPSFVLNMLLNGTPGYLLLTTCLAFVYYGAITGIELLLHQSTNSHIILITTALTWTIILDPVRVSVQSFIERRFNLGNRAWPHRGMPSNTMSGGSLC